MTLSHGRPPEQRSLLEELSGLEPAGLRARLEEILRCGPDLVAADIELVDKPRREYYLRAVVEQLAEAYDYVLLDCPPSLGIVTLNALRLSRLKTPVEIR